MPKPRIAVLNQGLPSVSLTELTGLPLTATENCVDYLLGYGAYHEPLVQQALDGLTTDLYLQLQPTDKAQGSIVVDGLQGILGFRRHPARLLHEPLIKAIGANKGYQPSVIDATAGWGTDAFLLASFGCRLTLIETDALVGALLADGLRRWHAAKQSPIDLRLGQAIDVIPTLATPGFPEVIYLDPMFPVRQKTALVKKNMAFLQQWLDETEHSDTEALLLHTARRYSKKRVVVKRPQSAAYLAGIKPSGAIITRHHRYDIYAPSL